MHSIPPAMRIAWTLVFLLVVSESPCLAQESVTDSLVTTYRTAKHDTLKVKALIALAENVYLADPDKAMEYCEEVRTISERIDYTVGRSTAYGWLAYLHEQKGNIDEALTLNQKSLALFEQLGDKKQMATCLNNIGAMYADMGRTSDAFDHHELSLKLKEEIGDRGGIASSLNNLGLLYFQKEKYTEAMDHYQRSLVIYQEVGDQEGVGTALHNIAGVYQKQDKLALALEHHQKELHIRQQMNDQYGLAGAYNNIGKVLDDQGAYKDALENFDKALEIRERISDRLGTAYTLRHIGELLKKMGRMSDALSYLTRSLDKFRELGDRKNEAMVLQTCAEIALELNELTIAARHAERALALNREIKWPEGIRKAAQVLSGIYGKQGRWEESFRMNQLFLTLRDSDKKTMPGLKTFDPMATPGQAEAESPKQGEWVQAFSTRQLFQHMLDSVRNETTRSLTVKNQLENDYAMKTLADSLQYVRRSETIALEVARKEADIQRQRVALLSTGVVILLLLVLAMAIFFGKKRSDGLLLNILPRETAEELKRSGSAKARHFDSVTVIFTDFKGFTTISEQLSPQLLVEEINECFSAFDRVMELHGVEKIKTIGDSYMAAGGLPTENATHAIDVVRAALDIQHYMEQLGATKKAKGIPYFEIRIGIHTGPVVAGIVGIRKFQYDIWGDTVNTASRMESAGEVGRVNISESTYLQVKDHFNCTFRGEIETKGKGHVSMYFVDGQATAA
ncbi:MAG: tetratricopeptide repeat protein [Flavobacteriales bacterium]|nr:tetratricopeptide repeat protein [Flavobacteriales bacterium]